MLAVVVALVVAVAIGLTFVALFDRGPSRRPSSRHTMLDELSWSAVYDYFFPPSH